MSAQLDRDCWKGLDEYSEYEDGFEESLKELRCANEEYLRKVEPYISILVEKLHITKERAEKLCGKIDVRTIIKRNLQTPPRF